MSETIPEDVIRKAMATYDALGRGQTLDERTIAKAILAERERCAQIAEDSASDHGWDYHVPSVGRAIAERIRNAP